MLPQIQRRFYFLLKFNEESSLSELSKRESLGACGNESIACKIAVAATKISHQERQSLKVCQH